MKHKILIIWTSFIFLHACSMYTMEAPRQRIGILAFGSLVENPGNLQLEEQNGFKTNGQQGPAMRIDYARKSNDNRLTLVIAPGMNAREMKSFYATFRGNDVNEAIKALREREGTVADNIGYINLSAGTYRRKDFNPVTGTVELKRGQIGDTYYNSNPMLQRIVEWAQAQHYTAVIWTDLPPTFTKNQFTFDTLKNHLANLPAEALLKAYCYFKITPTEIRNSTRFGNELMSFAAQHLRTRTEQVNALLQAKGIRNDFEHLSNADCIKIIWG